MNRLIQKVLQDLTTGILVVVLVLPLIAHAEDAVQPERVVQMSLKD